MNPATGSTCDTSPLLRFHFWKPVCFNSDESSFPDNSTENTVRLSGISENIGHDMNFYILNTTTNEFIRRSNARLAGESTSPNLRIDPLTTPEVVTSLHPPSRYLKDKEEAPVVTEYEIPNDSTYLSKHNMPVLDPNELVGGLFLFYKKIVHVCEIE